MSVEEFLESFVLARQSALHSRRVSATEFSDGAISLYRRAWNLTSNSWQSLWIVRHNSTPNRKYQEFHRDNRF
ncbi:MAG: hypothetical protein JWM11_4166 [Planctomycetaceae bacterium]|nr:hypothetical protein [Planctomycetaceae bacterium]